MNDAELSKVPLCVDLDGTLCRGDASWESTLLMVFRQPLKLLVLPFWLLGGRAAFKARVTARMSPDALELTLNEALLEYLRREPRRPLYLVSGANQAIVESVARRVPIFAGCFGSDEHTNLTGAAKAARLVAQFGEKGFDYAGNARIDLKVWSHARAAIIVNAGKSLRVKAERRFPIEAVITEKHGLPLCEWLRCLRPHQWAINLLVFAPFFLAPLGNDLHLLVRMLLAFGAFCGIASALSVFDDLFDLQADRRDAHKRDRPLASGAVSVLSALIILVLSLGFGAALAVVAGAACIWLLAGYVVVSALDTIVLKQIALLDVAILSALYTTRIVGGAWAAVVTMPVWFLGFSFFLFLSFGLAKRYIVRSPLA
jgi:hypothetical protein